MNGPDGTDRVSDRIQIGHVPVDRLTLSEAIAAILRLATTGRGGTVFTPNIDHVVRAEHDSTFRHCYRGTTLSVVDGMPLVWASHVLRAPLPQKASGSDWIERFLEQCSHRGHSVYFLGGREGAGALAKERLQAKYPGLQVCGVGPRTREIEADRTLLDIACRDIVAARPAFVIVAVGSPLQELWATNVREVVAPTVLLCLGSALDLMAGLIGRSPRWMSRVGLEWLFNFGREPRRLWRRYLVGGPKFLTLVLRQLAGQSRRVDDPPARRG